MKKIALIASVKNECDIIESYCRYNLSFCDALLIHENHKSSDNTREIIQKLIDEGLPIYFEAEEDMYYETAKNVMAGIAVDKYNADLVIQLDADEFLCHVDGLNPREVLENIDEEVEYQIPWRTYVYDGEPDGAVFMPGNFSRYRNPAFDEALGHPGKTFISKYLLKEKQAKFILGAHFLNYPSEHEATRKAEMSKELICAHYPIRSEGQVLCKAIPNYINKWALPEAERFPSSFLTVYQLGTLFDTVRTYGEVPKAKMKEISISYSFHKVKEKAIVDRLLRDLGDEVTVEGAIDTAFCADRLALKYTDAEDNKQVFLKATLGIIDVALHHLDDESRSKTEEVRRLTGLEQHHNDFMAHHNNLQDHYNMAIEQRDTLTAQHGDLTKQHIDLRYHYDAAIQQRDELSRLRDNLLRQHNVLTEQHNVLTEQHNVLTEQHNVLTEQHNKTLWDNEKLTERIDEILSSRAWKIGSKLSRAAGAIIPRRRS